jgi:hypothetical protein
MILSLLDWFLIMGGKLDVKCKVEKQVNYSHPPFVIPEIRLIFALPLIVKAMSVTRLKRKNRKDKAKSAVRRQSLKLQNFQPVMKTVDIEKIKEEFKAKKA